VYPAVVRAPVLWSGGVTGRHVAVAVLDSGVARDADLGDRVIASVNFADPRTLLDPGGHGTHIAGTIAGDGSRSAGEFVGVAPGADIVDVRVLDSRGGGRISSVIRGVEWVLAHRQAYGIRVINMSFGAPARTSYRADPLASAIEIAWRAGLVVVAASGNGGPARDSTVTPGNDPYAITVGATDDAGTIDTGDDSLAPFSAWGSADSNAKPDLVAPGRRIVSIRVAGSALDTLFPDRVVRARNGAEYLRLSGTSMATAVASGAVALLLERDGALTPDQVKTALVASARPYGPNGAPPLPDPIADGSGLLDVLAASQAATREVPSARGDAIGAITTTELPLARRVARPADAFARSLFPLLARLPLRWKDPGLGGLAWNTLTWDSVVWDSVAWDNFDWDSVAWDSVAWDSVAWDSVAWDSVAWDSVAWDSVAWDAFTFD
jgi:serine protease AprX